MPPIRLRAISHQLAYWKPSATSAKFRAIEPYRSWSRRCALMTLRSLGRTRLKTENKQPK
jgi:hypothetical protein